MWRAPPFGADAFRALRTGDVIGRAAPAKSPWRTVGDKRGDFGRFGAGQQQKRTRLLRGRPGRKNFAADRRQNFRAFGEMTGDGRKTPHASPGRDVGGAYRSRPRSVPRDRHAPTLTSPLAEDKEVNSICRAGIGSAWMTASPTASKPKPASSIAASASSLSSIRRATWATLRVGAVRPISMVSTAPSTR